MLIDSSKFGRSALLNIVEPWAVAGVITDSQLSPAEAKAYRARGVNLIIADRLAPKYRSMGPEDELIARYRASLFDHLQFRTCAHRIDHDPLLG